MTAASTFVVSPFLLAELGVRRFGVWALLVGTMAIAGLADLGFGSALVREVARADASGERRRARGALALGLLVSGAVGLVLIGTVLVLWPVCARVFHLGPLAGQARTGALLLALAFLLDGLGVPWRSALEGSQRMLPVAAVVAATTLVGSALGVGLVALGFSLRGLGLAALAASGLRVIALIACASRCVPGLSPSLRSLGRGEARALLAYGLRVQVSSGAAAVNNDTDRLVLGAFFAPALVAPFDLGSKLANVLRIGPWHALAALFPAAAALDAARERAELDRLYLRASRYLALFASLGALNLAVCAEPLVRLWLGRPLPFAAETVALLAPAYGVNVLGGAAAALARAEGVPARETRYSVLTAALNAALTLLLLRWLGALGVPLATTVAYVLGTAYFFVHFHRSSRRPLRPLTDVIWKPVLAANLAAAATWAARGLMPEPAGRMGAAVEVIGRAGLATLVFAAALAALRYRDDEDGALLRRLGARMPLSRRGGRVAVGAGHGR